MTITLKEPVFYVPGCAWIIDQAALVAGEYLSFYQRKTLEQMATQYPGVQLVEMDDAIAQSQEAVRLPVSEITQEQFDDALGCMPPQQWHHSDGAESFKCCEHYSGNITSIYARVGVRFFHMRDHFKLPHAEIISRCNASIQEAA